MILGIICFFVPLVLGQNPQSFSFLQLSNDGTGNDCSALDDDSKILTVFLLNVVGCIVICAAIQGMIILSKRMSNELINLQRNYMSYTEYNKFNDLKRNYSNEKESIEKIQLDN